MARMNSDPNAAIEGRADGASGLFQSLTNLIATFVAMAHTRLELLTTELQEEIHRAAGLVVWALIALVTALLGLFLGALAIIFAFWDTHRLLAALSVTAAFILMTAIALLMMLRKIRARPRFLDATLNELKNDAAHLRARS